MSGYARIHRSLLGHHAFRNDAEAMAFAWLVIRASWHPAKVRYKGRTISLQRGQLAISVRDFADAMDRDKAWCERLLTRLRRETMVKTSDETGVNVITICNYATYQADMSIGETANDTDDETDVRQTRDTEQRIKETNTSEPKGSSGGVKRARRLPDEWVPRKPYPVNIAELVLQWPPGREDRELEGFRAYWKSRSRDATRLDWDLTWHNRIRDQHDRIVRDTRNGHHRNGRPSITDALQRAYAEEAAERGETDYFGAGRSLSPH